MGHLGRILWTSVRYLDLRYSSVFPHFDSSDFSGRVYGDHTVLHDIDSQCRREHSSLGLVPTCTTRIRLRLKVHLDLITDQDQIESPPNLSGAMNVDRSSMVHSILVCWNFEAIDEYSIRCEVWLKGQTKAKVLLRVKGQPVVRLTTISQPDTRYTSAHCETEGYA